MSLRFYGFLRFCKSLHFFSFFFFLNRRTLSRRRRSAGAVRRPCDIRAVTARFLRIIYDNKSYVNRRENARVQSEIVGTSYGHRIGLCTIYTLSVRRPCDFLTISLRSPYDSDSESQSKIPYDARMNCKHKRRSQRSPTMFKNLKDKRRPKHPTLIEANVT